MLSLRAVTWLRWVNCIRNGSASITAIPSVVHRHPSTASVLGRNCHAYHLSLCTTTFNRNKGSSPGNDESGGGVVGDGGNDGFDESAMYRKESVRYVASSANLSALHGSLL